MAARDHRGALTAHGMGRLALGALACAVISACGSGGGARSDAPPLNAGSPGVQTPPTTPPPPPPTTPVVSTPDPAYGTHLQLTNTAAARTAGLIGTGTTIGVVDTGVNRNHPSLAGRVAANLNYVDARANDLTRDDVVGHGTAVSQIMAGAAFGAWPGGIAPGARIVSARIIADQDPVDDGSGQGNEVSGALGLAPVHSDLIARGVKIMNNSWGGLYWTNPSATAPIAQEYRPFIQSNGGLVVFATGNESMANPTDMSALPSQQGPNGTLPAADLEQGWLAVAALDTAAPTQLASYSNACGIAMRYCLVAPGTVVVTGTDNAANAPEYWEWSGTSFAAPQVSGAAAVVWQAFPYFSNDLVRQTLLGTATD
ncbi:MAG: S8 family peptidase, partial [Duganella sp.]